MDAQELERLRSAVKGILYDIRIEHLSNTALYANEIYDWSDLGCFGVQEYHDNWGDTGLDVYLSGVNEQCHELKLRINIRLVEMGYEAAGIHTE